MPNAVPVKKASNHKPVRKEANMRDHGRINAIDTECHYSSMPCASVALRYVSQVVSAPSARFMCALTSVRP